MVTMSSDFQQIDSGGLSDSPSPFVQVLAASPVSRLAAIAAAAAATPGAASNTGPPPRRRPSQQSETPSHGAKDGAAGDNIDNVKRTPSQSPPSKSPRQDSEIQGHVSDETAVESLENAYIAGLQKRKADEGNLKAHIESLRDSFERELSEWASAQRSLELRLNRLRDIVGKQDRDHSASASRDDLAELRGRLEVLETTLHGDIAEQACLRQKELRELREALATEVRSREAMRDGFHDVMKKHFDDNCAFKELQNSTYHESFENRVSQERSHFQQQVGQMKERLVKLEGSFANVEEKQANDISTLSEKLGCEIQGRLWEYHGSVRDPCAALKERVERLEDVIGEATSDIPLVRRLREASPEASADESSSTPHFDSSPVEGRRSRSTSKSFSPRPPACRKTLGLSVADRLGNLETAEKSAMQAREGDQQKQFKEDARIKERFEAIERLMRDIATKHSQELEATAFKQESEGQARIADHAMLKEGLISAHQSVQEHAARQVALDAAHNKLRDQLTSCHADLSKERDSKKEMENTMQDRLNNIEKHINDNVASMRQDVDRHQEAFKHHYETVRDHLSSEKRRRESHEDVLKKTLEAEANAREEAHATVHDKIIEVKNSLQDHRADLHEYTRAVEHHVGCEVQRPGVGSRHPSETLSTTTLAVPPSASSPTARSSRLASSGMPLTKRVEYLEADADQKKAQYDELHRLWTTAMTDEHDTRGQCQKVSEERFAKLEGVHAKTLSQLQSLETQFQHKVGQLSSERDMTVGVAHTKLREEIMGQLNKEREAREAFHDTVKEHLAGDRKMRADHQSELHSKTDMFEQKIQNDLVSIKAQINTEVQSRVKHYETVQEHLNTERRARENHDKASKANAAEERDARQALEGLLHDRLNRESATRENHHEQVRGHLQQEKLAREGLHQCLEERAQASTTASDQAQRQLQAALVEERSFREQHGNFIRDLEEREQAARKQLEDRFAREGNDMANRQQFLEQAVKSLTHDVDAAVRSVETTNRQVQALLEQTKTGTSLGNLLNGRVASHPLERNRQLSWSDSPRRGDAHRSSAPAMLQHDCASTFHTQGAESRQFQNGPTTGHAIASDDAARRSEAIPAHALVAAAPSPTRSAQTNLQQFSATGLYQNAPLAAYGRVSSHPPERTRQLSWSDSPRRGDAHRSSAPAMLQHDGASTFQTQGAESRQFQIGLTTGHAIASDDAARRSEAIPAYALVAAAPSPTRSAQTNLQQFSATGLYQNAQLGAFTTTTSYGPPVVADGCSAVPLPISAVAEDVIAPLKGGSGALAGSTSMPCIRVASTSPSHGNRSSRDLGVVASTQFQQPLQQQLFGTRTSADFGKIEPSQCQQQPVPQLFTGMLGLGNAVELQYQTQPAPLVLSNNMGTGLYEAPLQPRSPQMIESGTFIPEACFSGTSAQPPPLLAGNGAEVHGGTFQPGQEYAVPADGLALVSQGSPFPSLPIRARSSRFTPGRSVVPNFPRLLNVESPNGHMSCIGEYAMIAGELRNGFPIWKQKVGDRWLYSGTNGKWYIAGPDAKDQNFSCKIGVINSSHAHLGASPDKAATKWMRKYGADFYEDGAIKVTAVAEPRWPTSSRQHRLE